MRRCLAVFLSILGAALFLLPGEPRGAEPKPPTREELVAKAVVDLVKMQEDGGQWPYEGVHRVERQIPIGYRVGGTAIVAGTLLAAAPEDRDAQAAVRRGLDFVLKELKAPGMEPSTKDVYDVRVWGHASALEFLCHMRAAKATI